jgi:hypothetical protein
MYVTVTTLPFAAGVLMALHRRLFYRYEISRMTFAAAACSLSPQSAYMNVTPRREDECNDC